MLAGTVHMHRIIAIRAFRNLPVGIDLHPELIHGFFDAHLDGGRELAEVDRHSERLSRYDVHPLGLDDLMHQGERDHLDGCRCASQLQERSCFVAEVERDVPAIALADSLVDLEVTLTEPGKIDSRNRAAVDGRARTGHGELLRRVSDAA